MRYMLDTNICIYASKRKPPEVIGRFMAHKAEDLCISAITYAELMHGAEKSERPAMSRVSLMLFLSPITIIDFDQDAAEEYGLIKADLQRKGTPIGPMDTLIAAHARSQNLILVTHNTREFERVEHLTVEDWAV